MAIVWGFLVPRLDNASDTALLTCPIPVVTACVIMTVVLGVGCPKYLSTGSMPWSVENHAASVGSWAIETGMETLKSAHLWLMNAGEISIVWANGSKLAKQ